MIAARSIRTADAPKSCAREIAKKKNKNTFSSNEYERCIDKCVYAKMLIQKYALKYATTTLGRALRAPGYNWQRCREIVSICAQSSLQS